MWVALKVVIKFLEEKCQGGFRGWTGRGQAVSLLWWMGRVVLKKKNRVHKPLNHKGQY